MMNGNEKKVKISSSRLKELLEKEKGYDAMQSYCSSLERGFQDSIRAKDVWAKHCIEAETELREFKTDFHEKIRNESLQYINNLLNYYANSIANSFEKNLKNVRCGFWGAKISDYDLVCLKNRLRQMIKSVPTIDM